MQYGDEHENIPSKVVSRAALEIAKEQVSADYQKHAAAKRFETQREVLVQEKCHIEAQLSQCRIRNSELHAYLKSSEELARSMTERCKTLEIARRNEESLRIQAENRESTLFNLLLAEESRRSQQDAAQLDLEKKISQIQCTNTIFNHLESTITQLKAELIQEKQFNIEKEHPDKGSGRAFEEEIADLKIKNKCLQDELLILKNRIPTVEPISPAIISNISKPLLEQQAAILKEKEALEKDNLLKFKQILELKATEFVASVCNCSSRRADLNLQDKLTSAESILADVTEQLRLIFSRNGLVGEPIALISKLGDLLQRPPEEITASGSASSAVQPQQQEPSNSELEDRVADVEAGMLGLTEARHAAELRAAAAEEEAQRARAALADAREEAERAAAAAAELRSSVARAEARLQEAVERRREAEEALLEALREVDRLSGADARVCCDSDYLRGQHNFPSRAFPGPQESRPNSKAPTRTLACASGRAHSRDSGEAWPWRCAALRCNNVSLASWTRDCATQFIPSP